MISGMHIQQPQIAISTARKAAARYGVGGRRYRPRRNVSGGRLPAPRELGEGTDQLVARLDASVAPPPAQSASKTKSACAERIRSAYDLIPLKSYLMCTLQFSSGCPIAASSATFPDSMAASLA